MSVERAHIRKFFAIFLAAEFLENTHHATAALTSFSTLSLAAVYVLVSEIRTRAGEGRRQRKQIMPALEVRLVFIEGESRT